MAQRPNPGGGRRPQPVKPRRGPAPGWDNPDPSPDNSQTSKANPEHGRESPEQTLRAVTSSKEVTEDANTLDRSERVGGLGNCIELIQTVCRMSAFAFNCWRTLRKHLNPFRIAFALCAACRRRVDDNAATC